MSTEQEKPHTTEEILGMRNARFLDVITGENAAEKLGVSHQSITIILNALQPIRNEQGEIPRDLIAGMTYYIDEWKSMIVREIRKNQVVEAVAAEQSKLVEPLEPQPVISAPELPTLRVATEAIDSRVALPVLIDGALYRKAVAFSPGLEKISHENYFLTMFIHMRGGTDENTPISDEEATVLDMLESLDKFVLEKQTSVSELARIFETILLSLESVFKNTKNQTLFDFALLQEIGIVIGTKLKSIVTDERITGEILNLLNFIHDDTNKLVDELRREIQKIEESTRPLHDKEKETIAIVRDIIQKFEQKRDILAPIISWYKTRFESDVAAALAAKRYEAERATVVSAPAGRSEKRMNGCRNAFLTYILGPAIICSLASLLTFYNGQPIYNRYKIEINNFIDSLGPAKPLFEKVESMLLGRAD